MLLATHELGVEGEVVTVEEPAEPVMPEESESLPQAGSDLLVVFGMAVAAWRWVPSCSPASGAAPDAIRPGCLALWTVRGRAVVYGWSTGDSTCIPSAVENKQNRRSRMIPRTAALPVAGHGFEPWTSGL